MKIYPHYSTDTTVNTYLVGNDETRQAIIIDPGKVTGELLHCIEKNHYDLVAVFITHNHKSHHIYGLKTVQKIYTPKIYAADSGLVNKNGKVLHKDGVLSVAGFDIECFSVPGHSPDSYLFKIQNTVFTGDSIMAGMMGKTFHSFAKKNLLENLKKKLFVMNDNLVLFPGHGPPSTLQVEKQFTSFDE